MLTKTKLKLPVSKNDHILGPPIHSDEAFVTLVMYGDYECSYCGEAHQKLKGLRRELGDDLRYVFRNFPMAQLHPYAMNAAKAAEAAALQGRFWPMHDLLFENQLRLDAESLLSFAATLNLDLRSFLADADSDKIEERILLDFYGGARTGVHGTPVFFLNGYRYEGDWRSEDFIATLEMLRGGEKPLAPPRRFEGWGGELRT